MFLSFCIWFDLLNYHIGLTFLSCHYYKYRNQRFNQEIILNCMLLLWFSFNISYFLLISFWIFSFKNSIPNNDFKIWVVCQFIAAFTYLCVQFPSITSVDDFVKFSNWFFVHLYSMKSIFVCIQRVLEISNLFSFRVVSWFGSFFYFICLGVSTFLCDFLPGILCLFWYLVSGFIFFSFFFCFVFQIECVNWHHFSLWIAINQVNVNWRF